MINLDKLSGIRSAVSQASGRFSIDDALVLAIIWQETKGEGFAPRLEINYWQNNRYLDPVLYAHKLGISIDTEKVLQSMSWGHMQLMGVVLRELGYDGLLTKICLPDVGIYWGCKKLDQLLVKYSHNVDSVIASWNAGSPQVQYGRFINQPYVDAVKGYLMQLKALGV